MVIKTLERTSCGGCDDTKKLVLQPHANAKKPIDIKVRGDSWQILRLGSCVEALDS